jgi:hypothetical protein
MQSKLSKFKKTFRGVLPSTDVEQTGGLLESLLLDIFLSAHRWGFFQLLALITPHPRQSVTQEMLR